MTHPGLVFSTSSTLFKFTLILACNTIKKVGIVESKDDLSIRAVCVIYKHYALLYNGLEHPRQAARPHSELLTRKLLLAFKLKSSPDLARAGIP